MTFFSLALSVARRALCCGLLRRWLSALRLRQKLREDHGMVDGGVARCVHQSCFATSYLSQNLHHRSIRFQFVAVTLLKLSESVCAMIEPYSE
jgi:hypothetical protein